MNTALKRKRDVKPPKNPSSKMRKLDAPNIENIYKSRAEEIELFVESLRHPNTLALLKDNEYFSSLMEVSVSEYGLSQKKLAEILEQSPSQVSRICSGLSMPKRYARASMVEAMAGLFEEKIQELQDRESSKTSARGMA